MYEGRWVFSGEYVYQCFYADVRVDGADDIYDAVGIVLGAALDRAKQVSSEIGSDEDVFWTWIDVFGECSLPWLTDYGIWLETNETAAGNAPDDVPVDAEFDSTAAVVSIVDGEARLDANWILG